MSGCNCSDTRTTAAPVVSARDGVTSIPVEGSQSRAVDFQVRTGQRPGINRLAARHFFRTHLSASGYSRFLKDLGAPRLGVAGMVVSPEGQIKTGWWRRDQAGSCMVGALTPEELSTISTGFVADLSKERRAPDRRAACGTSTFAGVRKLLSGVSSTPDCDCGPKVSSCGTPACGEGASSCSCGGSDKNIGSKGYSEALKPRPSGIRAASRESGSPRVIRDRELMKKRVNLLLSAHRSGTLSAEDVVKAVAQTMEPSKGGTASEEGSQAQPGGPPAIGQGKQNQDERRLPLPGEGNTCYRYPMFEKMCGDSAFSCPWEFLEEWSNTPLEVCVPDSLDYKGAVAALNMAFAGGSWEEALWNLVGLKHIPADSILADNLAPEAVEPLWYEWRAADTGYSPQVSRSPRQTMMLRALSMVTEFRVGVPKVWEGFAVQEGVVDPIAAGAMDYRIYAPKMDEKIQGWYDHWAALVAEIVEVGDAIQRIGQQLKSMGQEVGGIEDLVKSISERLLQGFDGSNTDELMDDILALLSSFFVILLDFLFEILEDLTNILILFGGLIAELVFLLATGFDFEEAAVEKLIRPAMCSGVDRQLFVHGPQSGPTDGFLFKCGTCCTAGRMVDMTRAVFNFRYEGYNTDVGAEVGANHGFLEQPGFAFGNKVWFCSLAIDRVAVTFDWLVAQATRHLAASFTSSQCPFEQHLMAANLCLRMALSVIATFDQWLIHETAHNLSLWHCSVTPGVPSPYEPDRPTGCVQDAAGWIWWSHVTAVLGLPTTANSYDPDPRSSTSDSTVAWDLTFGLTHNRCLSPGSSSGNGEIEASVGLAPALMSDWCPHVRTTGTSYFQPYQRTDLECRANSTTPQDRAGLRNASTMMRNLSTTLGETDPNIDFLENFAFNIAGILASISTEWGMADLYANMNFNIDRPLNMGGIVTWCCVMGRTGCTGEAEPVPCWTVDPPGGYRGCCCPPQPEKRLKEHGLPRPTPIPGGGLIPPTTWVDPDPGGGLP